MSVTPSIVPALACLVSVAAAIGIIIFRKSPNLREGVTIFAGIIKLCLVLSMIPLIMDGQIIQYTITEILPGIGFEFRVDAIGILFATLASGLWIVTSIYSIGYMRGLNEHSQTRFYCFFAIALSCTLGVAFAGNLFTLYVFYELLSMSTYPLVAHHQDKDARGGARTYLAYLFGTSVAFLLPAMIYCYLQTGDPIQFTSAGVLEGNIDNVVAIPLLLLMVYGFAKCGLMPVHSWLPGAMVAPTPVSALLHAVAVVKVGVFCVIRVFTGVFGYEYLKTLDAALVISWIAAFTVIASSLVALSQDNLKRRLAFSTVGQLSYIVLGVSLLSSSGFQGSIMHIIMHAFGKITLFFCAGAIFVATGKKYISQMVGIGKRMPITMTAFFIGSLSVIGIPFTGGFISKFYLLWGTADTGQYLLLGVFLLSSILNAAYFLPIVFNAFFCAPDKSQYKDEVKEAPLCCVIPLSFTAIVSIGLFLFPEPLYRLSQLALSQI